MCSNFGGKWFRPGVSSFSVGKGAHRRIMMQKKKRSESAKSEIMSRKRHGTGLFNHAAATKKKCESEKGQVVPMSGSYLRIVLM